MLINVVTELAREGVLSADDLVLMIQAIEESGISSGNGRLLIARGVEVNHVKNKEMVSGGITKDG